MIRSRQDLELELRHGETVSRLADDGGRFRWAVTGTGEQVHLSTLAAAIRREAVRVVGRDLTGEPMQYGAAA